MLTTPRICRATALRRETPLSLCQTEIQFEGIDSALPSNNLDAFSTLSRSNNISTVTEASGLSLVGLACHITRHCVVPGVLGVLRPWWSWRIPIAYLLIMWMGDNQGTVYSVR
jgi:hypothetical protein